MTRFTDSPYERMMTRRPEGGKETSRPIVKAKKSLGQHFLKDQNIARKIIDSLLPVTAEVLEIG